MKRATFAAVLSFGLLCGNHSMAADFECPVPGNLSAAPLPAEIMASIPKGEALQQPDQLQSAIIMLREHGMASDDIVNRLIALYCPYAASDASSNIEQKTAQVQAFAANASAAVYSEGQDRAFIYNIPLPPDVAEIAMQRAREAGISTEQWIADAIGRAVK